VRIFQQFTNATQQIEKRVMRQHETKHSISTVQQTTIEHTLTKFKKKRKLQHYNMLLQ